MMYWNGDWGWAGWLLMCLSMVVFWGFIAWVVITALRVSATVPRDHDHHRGLSAIASDPESLLAERFARGEIDEEEYRHRLDVLRHARSTPVR